MHTTYALAKNSFRQPFYTPLIFGFLFINRQIRHEAVSFFYGENTFHFESMKAIIPFLQDQSAATLGAITSLQFRFRLVHEDYDEDRPTYVGEYHEHPYGAFPGDLADICQDLGEVENLNTKRLRILISDPQGDFESIPSDLLDDDAGWWGYEMNWIHRLPESVTDLEAFDIVYYGSPENADGDVRKVETGLWNFLAPRMLRRIGDRHDPYTLQDRRIRNQEQAEEDY